MPHTHLSLNGAPQRSVHRLFHGIGPPCDDTGLLKQRVVDIDKALRHKPEQYQPRLVKYVPGENALRIGVEVDMSLPPYLGGLDAPLL